MFCDEVKPLFNDFKINGNPMQKTLLALAIAAIALPSQALTTGDLAFTSFNADEDGWAMVAFTEIAAGTKVYFSDNEWNGSAFNTGESYSSWTSGASAIAAGTVIRFSATDTTSLAASIGTLSRVAVSGSSNYGFSQGAETLYAYLGASATATPSTFLAAISTGAFSVAEGGLINTGLSVGSGAVQLKNSSDFAEYTGVRSGLNAFSDYKALTSNVANWNDRGDGSYASLVPNTTAFTVAAAVPEPTTYALMLAGLAAVGFVARRRAAK